MFSSFITLIFAISSIVAGLPSTDSSSAIDAGLRLIKTSETDPGTWVTEEQKIVEYVSHNRYFIDITDIKNETTLARLSTAPKESLIEARAVTYPTTLTHQTQANALISQLTTTGPKSWLTTFTNYYNRYCRSSYGTQAGTWLLSQVKSIASTNTAIIVTTFTHSFDQPPFIAKIPGINSDLIIVGAGVVTILEALRVIAASGFKPENTLEFHFYAGEEGGLFGLQAVFDNYASSGKTVLAFLCQDMTGYSPSGKVSLYTDYSNSGLVAYVRKIDTQYTGLTYTTDKCEYGCSDHASAYANGLHRLTPLYFDAA